MTCILGGYLYAGGMAKKSPSSNQFPDFLLALLEAKSPTGHEFAAQAVIDENVERFADHYRKDTLGNRIAELKGKNKI